MKSLKMFWRKKKEALPTPTLAKKEVDPYAETYEDANSWRAEFSDVYFCRNGLDNFPQEHISDDYVFAISQSRSPGHKDQGQDCIGQACHKDWEVRVLCDGHDRNGHMVSLGVCRTLPHIVLRLIHERAPNEISSPISDDLVNRAFEECERTVCWTSEGITQGVFVKVFEGDWKGKVGHVAEAVGAGVVSVVIVDENGYHRPHIEKKHLRGARYIGGSTCVCFIRNKITDMCRVAVCGDSRLVILPSGGLKDPVLMSIQGEGEEGQPKPVALITPSHNVFNASEIHRLETSYKGQYEFDGNFLVNPVTKFAIQPTRGFGDFDMWGTGYTNNPEVSNAFKLMPGSIVFAASDGVFDPHVWQDDEFITFLANNQAAGINAHQLVDFVFRETLNRSLDGGYVDDISMFCYMKPAKKETPKEIITEPIVKQPSKRVPKSKRQTIKRDDNSAFTALSEKMKEIQTQMSQRDLQKTTAVAALEYESDPELEKEDEQTTEKVGELLQRFAKKYGHSFDNLPAKELVTGQSFHLSKNKDKNKKLVEDDELSTASTRTLDDL